MKKHHMSMPKGHHSEEGEREKHESSMGHPRGRKMQGMHKEGPYDGGFVTGHEESIGHGNFANLPQNPVMSLYPKARQDKGGMLDDTISDIDAIENFAEGQRTKYMSYQK